MPQLTLTALYGEKPPAVSSFIASCQGMLSSAFGRAFRAYEAGQVHATIVGLEHNKGSFPQNANFQDLRGQRREMDLSGFLERLRASSELPFQVQIGGFAEQDRPFASRGMPPYSRGFSIQGDKVVVIGWPCETDAPGMPQSYPQSLDALRRRAQEFGILHRYHGSESDRDNDFFFRIGLVDRGYLFDAAVRNLEEAMRRHLSGLQPLMVEVGLEDLHVAAYRDERLPARSTRFWSVIDPGLDERMRTLAGTCDRDELDSRYAGGRPG